MKTKWSIQCRLGRISGLTLLLFYGCIGIHGCKSVDEHIEERSAEIHQFIQELSTDP
jgi:hypothetical protein